MLADNGLWAVERFGEVRLEAGLTLDHFANSKVYRVLTASFRPPPDASASRAVLGPHERRTGTYLAASRPSSEANSIDFQRTYPRAF